MRTSAPAGRTVLVMIGIVFIGCVLSSFLYAEEPQKSGQEKKEPSAAELVKTKAGQLFVTRRFEEALEEFKALSREYPQSIIIKRYIGACLDHLGRDEEAAAAFREVLAISPEELLSRQFLAKIYLRMGKLDEAEGELTFIAEHDKTGTFAPVAKSQLETVKKLKESEQKLIQAPGRQITPQAFLQTEAAKLFMKAKYKEALDELIKLETVYPGDVLIKRYKALTLDRLGRFEEALAVYEEGLKTVPENIPLHYFLAQTLLHKKDLDGAQREYRYVVENDESKTYQVKAQQEISAIQKLIELLKQAKKWTLNASAGVEYDTNPNSSSSNEFIKTASLKGALKFSNSLGGSYELFKKGPWSGRLSTSYYQALYGNSQNHLNTFSYSGGFTLTYIKMLSGKPLILQLGHTPAHTIVKDASYSESYATSATAIYSFKDWQRLILSEKWTVSNYDSNGSSNDDTSRDGFSNVLGVTNNFYLNKDKTLTIPLGFDWGRDDTEGSNYRKDSSTVRTGLGFPLFYQFNANLSFKFKDSNYPKYGFPTTTPGRRDEEYTFGAGISRPLGRNWTLNLDYSYVNNNSRDDNFTYQNHSFGFTINYNY